MKIIEKKHRLPQRAYTGRVIVSFTLCIKNKAQFFVDHKIFSTFKGMILTEAKAHNCEILVYLFMPDHCHILLQGKNKDSQLLNVINRFKQRSGYWLSKHSSGVRWQKDYYDHILRKDGDVQKQVKYILNNPIRKQIVGNWKQYQFKGSTVYNIYK